MRHDGTRPFLLSVLPNLLPHRAAPVVAALRSILGSLAGAANATSTDSLATAAAAVAGPLMELALVDKPGRTKVLLVLTRGFLSAATARPLAVGLATLYHSSSAKQRLQLTRLLRRIVDDPQIQACVRGNPGGDSAVGEGNAGRTVAIATAEIADAIVEELRLAEADVVKHGPTKLAVESADVVVAIARNISRTAHAPCTAVSSAVPPTLPTDVEPADHSGLFDSAIAQTAAQCLTLLAGWYVSHHPLYSAAVDCLPAALHLNPEGLAADHRALAAVQFAHLAPLLDSKPVGPKLSVRLVRGAMGHLRELSMRPTDANSGNDSGLIAEPESDIVFLSFAGHLATIGLAVGRLSSESGMGILAEAEVGLTDLFGIFGHKFWARARTTMVLSKALLRLAFFSIGDSPETLEQLPQLIELIQLGDGVGK